MISASQVYRLVTLNITFKGILKVQLWFCQEVKKDYVEITLVGHQIKVKFIGYW